MADERIAKIKSRDDLIAEIQGVQDELEALGVKRERVKFWKFTEDHCDELAELLESFREQLKGRKKFLGEKVDKGEKQYE